MGDPYFPGPPRHPMILSSKGFRNEFLSPRLHHVMDFSFPDQKTLLTILTEMMTDEFNFLRPEIKNYEAEADADWIPIPSQLELHGRCRCGVLLSACFCALFVADLIVGMEELELQMPRQI